MVRPAVCSMQNAGVKRAVRLRRRRARDRERAFLIEGYRELLRAVEVRLPLEVVYHCPAFYLGGNEPALLDRARGDCGAELVPADDAVFAKLSFRDRPDGLLAEAALPVLRRTGRSIMLLRCRPRRSPACVLAARTGATCTL